MNVLIVEDELNIAETYKDLLDEIGKFDVDVAGDGLDAFIFCQRKDYALIICDHQMPFMTGGDFVKALRHKPGPNSHAPILLISGFLTLARECVKTIEDVIFLDKPVKREQLKRYLSMALQQKSTEIHP